MASFGWCGHQGGAHGLPSCPALVSLVLPTSPALLAVGPTAMGRQEADALVSVPGPVLLRGPEAVPHSWMLVARLGGLGWRSWMLMGFGSVRFACPSARWNAGIVFAETSLVVCPGFCFFAWSGVESWI